MTHPATSSPGDVIALTLAIAYAVASGLVLLRRLLQRTSPTHPTLSDVTRHYHSGDRITPIRCNCRAPHTGCSCTD